MSITKYTIYGERNSGTNYLVHLIDKNFDINITWDYGWKHFFGHNDLSNTDDTLFIAIVRNPYDWLNSMYKTPYHIEHMNRNIEKFCLDEIFSVIGFGNYDEIMQDRNIYTKMRYKNIFELRHIKLKFLIDDMPNKVKKYILIRHEDLLDDFENTMNKIKNMGLKVKDNMQFPSNINVNSKNPDINYTKPTYNDIPKDFFNNHLIKEYEEKLGYI
jgi:hypothetical protein